MPHVQEMEFLSAILVNYKKHNLKVNTKLAHDRKSNRPLVPFFRTGPTNKLINGLFAKLSSFKSILQEIYLENQIIKSSSNFCSTGLPLPPLRAPQLN